MNIMPFIIAAMLLVQFSMYAQNTGQVTLSIRLYPIQILEVTPSDAQTIELSNQSISQFTPTSQLSTFSTSQYAMHVDSVNCKVFKVLRAAREVPGELNKSINGFINAERYNFETDGDDLHVVYSMETL